MSNSKTPDRQTQRTKRGLPFSGSAPAKKKANVLEKQTPSGKITISDYAAQEMLRKKVRPSPGGRYPAKALTPIARKTCQRNLKKSSSYCGKNIISEEKNCERNFNSIRDNFRKKNNCLSGSRINPKENSVGVVVGLTSSSSSPASSKRQKHVKTLFEEKKKKTGEVEQGNSSLKSQKFFENIDNRTDEVDCDDMMTGENIRNNYSKPIAEIKPRQTACTQRSPFLPNKITPSISKADNYGDSSSQVNLASNQGPGNFSVHVAVRVRPFSEREKDNPDVHCVVEMYESSTLITESSGNSHNFTFDMSYWSFDVKDPTYCDQENVYKSSAQPLLDGVLQGYNTCLFAYGQTGSGKSYSMMGYQDSDAGIIPRFCEELFQRVEETSNVNFAVEISFFEIYNEKIRDLLTYAQENKKQLRVREHPDHGPYVQDLSMFTVRCYQDIEAWLAVGNKNRATAATGMNDKSSRSHSVFTISLRQSQEEVFEGSDTQLCRSSKVNLIDLAGSEKASYVINNEVSANQEAANNRLKEGSCINKSLHSLGKVISLLSEQQTGSKKKVFVPYRESVLTWLLKESLGGNSRTAMIATISPANIHFAETLSTLRYASQARNIVNQVRVNEDSNSKLIRELLCEIERLKSLRNPCQNESNLAYVTEIEMLRRKLKETTALLTESSRSWEAKHRQSEDKQQEEAERLRRSGVAFTIDNSLPNLVNLNEDPMLSEVLVYVLKEGKTTFGNSQSQQENIDIRLDGPLVADYHCCITYELKQVRITPIGDALTFVNGEQVSANTILRHGDRIVIGGAYFFGFKQPNTVKSNKREDRKKWDGLTLKDFEYAKMELTAQQNAKLEAELEESQMKAQEGLIDLITNATATSEKQIYLQKQAYKEEISNLQKMLEEAENEKKLAEENQQIAEDKIAELKSHKETLVEEIQLNRNRLQDEAKAAKQALEDTKANQMEVITELEIEKKRIEDDVRRLKSKKAQREVVRNEIRSALSSVDEKGAENKRDLLKIALLLREANKISQKLGKFIMFSRDDILENDKVEIRIRLNDTKFGKTTLWSLDKFEYMVGRMRELFQANGLLEEETEDPFCDPEDDWVEDFILDSPTTPEPSGSRMSVKKRYSLNHSLNMLTNLNASLSELSARRRSSYLSTSQGNDALVIKEEKENDVSALTILRDILEENTPSIEGSSVCSRLLRMISEAHTECANLLQASQRTCSMNPRLLWKIAITAERIKEAFSTWSSISTALQTTSLDSAQQTMSSLTATLFVDLKTLVKVVDDESGPMKNYVERLMNTLQSLSKKLGELSLGFSDCYQSSDNVLLNPDKEPILFDLFIDGQRSFWNICTRGWIKLMETFSEQLQPLQNLSQRDDDIDKFLTLLNSSSCLIQRIQDFMICFISVINGKARLALTERHLRVQREIVSSLAKYTGNIEKIVHEIQNSYTEDQTESNTEGLINNITKELVNIVQHCNCLAGCTKEGINTRRSGKLSDVDEQSYSLETASKGVETVAELICESMEQWFETKDSFSTDWTLRTIESLSSN